VFLPKSNREFSTMSNTNLNRIETTSPKPEARLETAQELLSRKIEAPKAILNGLIYENSLGMLSGDTGAGKTWLLLYLAYAVAAGKLAEPWGAGAGVPVVYLDGESDAKLFQKRFQQISNRDKNPINRKMGLSNFKIFGKTWNEEIPDLDTVNGQKYIEKLIEDEYPKLIIIDNLDTFCPTGLNNDKVYADFTSWVTSLVKRGISVLIAHHNNKAGKQHGSSVKMRRMNYALSLKKTKEIPTEKETSFFLTIEKSRSSITRLLPDTRFVIRTKDVEGSSVTYVLQEDLFCQKSILDNAVRKSLLQGESGKDIAKNLGASESMVSRIKKAMESEGVVF
jgi:RecA-family ATPase